MGIDLRYPNITGSSEREQLQQIKSYLHQLVQQLQWGMDNIGKETTTVISSTTQNGTTGSTPTLADPQATFDSIKALIIKSAEIVNVYSEEITKRLEGMYVAQSDFGDFKEQTSKETVENSKYTEDRFTHVEEILSNIDGIINTYKETNAHIRAGELEVVDGFAVIGLEVGERRYENGVEIFNKYARFTSDKLVFYDKAGNPLAYISDYKLYITHAEVTGTLKLGEFLIDTTDGITLTWEGMS